MRLLLKLLFITLSFLSHDLASAQRVANQANGGSDISHIEIEANRFLGLFLMYQCRVNEAQAYLGRALRDNPKDPKTLAAFEVLNTWPREESKRIYDAAKRNKGMKNDASEYFRALTCDPGNISAWKEVHRIMAAQK